MEFPDAVILPCPLLRRADSADLCGWFRQLDWDALPPHQPRIVLAHGGVHDFAATDLDPRLPSQPAHSEPTPLAVDTDEEHASSSANRLRIEGDWLERVDYIALGDWHGLKRVSAKAWYAGTPEPYRFPRSGDYQAGQVLRVDAERGATAVVLPLPTGTLGWHPIRFHCGADNDLERLERQLDELLEGRVGHDLLLLDLSGSLTLAGHARLNGLIERLEAQLLRLKRRGHCGVAPSAHELAELITRPADPLISRVAGILHERLERSWVV